MSCFKIFVNKKGKTMTEFGDTIIIDFNDEGSETFGLTFNKKKEFDEFCKVDLIWKKKRRKL